MIRKSLFAITVLLFLAAVSGSVFAQTGNASLGGTVQDPSKALIPGVTVTATNTETNVTVTQVTNESGAYSFPVLQPGTYRVTAELPGFKKAIHDKLQLGYATQSRDDFTLEVGAVTSTVEVTSNAVSLLRETSASVGDVLTEQRILNLPMVGNNVLSLLTTLPGINFGAGFDPGSNLGTDNGNTIAGLNMDTVNVTRDGLAMNDTRYSATVYGSQAFTSTRLNPDLIGEIRVILSPVDAELGRGNGQVQISTRSGTNRYSGAANWNVRNSALDANTWTNNHTPFTDPNTNVVTNHTLPAWNNLHEYSISYGGPVKFPGLYDGKNKTFFYGLVSGQIRNTRETTNVNVLTDTARLGIYRYWSGYNPTGWNVNNTTLSQTYPILASSATYPAVDYAGNPVAPPKNPDGSPYTGKLTCFSVFGTKRLDASFNLVPFTPADCAGGSISLPTTANGQWDAFRSTQDLSGYIKKTMEVTPHATYYGSGDGLNIAQFRWQRRRDGNNTNNAEVGGDLYANYRQYNLKIDHNFNSRHKASVNWSYQPEKSADNFGAYPGGISGEISRSVYVVTANVTSTLTSRMINEARFGVNHNFEYDNPAWFSVDPATRQKAEDFLIPGSPSTLNPSYTYLAVIGNGVGNVNNSAGYMETTTASSLITLNPLWNYADTLSWSKGKHAYKFGGEVRLPRTSGNGALQTYPTVTMGNNPSATSTASPFATSTNFATELPGLLNSALTGSGATAARTNVTSLLYYLTGSVSSATHQYWVNNADNVKNGLWSDYSTSGQRLRKQVWNEWNAFVKDDYKITKHLTLNLGVRWEFASAPYIDGGFTAAFKEFGYGAFGATRTAQTTLDAFNKDPFGIFLKPGNLFLTGYGSNPTAAPLSCQTGVKQNALLPTSTCNADAMSAILFVGPGSPNPSLKSEPVQYYNIGPAVGFAYTLPWFGEGKTTIRGGYQQTFGGAQAVRNNVPGGTEAEIANAPGAAASATTVVSDPTFQSILNTRALNLTDVKALVPVRPTTTPGLPVPIYGRFAGGAGGINVYDPNYKTPYTQNVNFSITRQLARATTLDIRYIGTFARNTKGSINLNTANVYDNPELFQALTDARAGTCTASAAGYKANYTDKGINPCDAAGDPVFLDQIMAGLNINTATTSTDSSGVTRTYGNVGTVVNGVLQSGAQQLRRSATFQANLANGDFFAVTNSLIGLAPTAAQGRQAAPINPATGGALGGVALIAMRNGCDRMANGFSIVQQTTAGGAQVAGSGTAIPLRCFPEDFLISNPQLGNITYISNYGHNNYHSLQVGISTRPINGITTQATWVWAKAMNEPATGFFDPADRNRNFGAQASSLHTLRMNGTVELPIGPNKFLLGNSSGILARLLERWQTSFIANMATGTPASVSPGTNHCYRATGTCRYNVTADWAQPKGKVEWNTVNPNTGAITGSYYGNPAPFTGVPDPQCVNPAIVTTGDKMGTSLVTSSTGTAVCNITALAQRNPDGTTGKYLLTYSMPGEIGNSGNNNVQLFGTWSLDMNLSKSFRISESKSLQVRFDATDVLNHPVLNAPSLSAGGGLGTISGKGNQTRKLQAQLRMTF